MRGWNLELKNVPLLIKRGKVIKSEGIKLPDDKIYKLSDDRQAYKYLGVLEADNIKNEEMRQIIEEYYR